MCMYAFECVCAHTHASVFMHIELPTEIDPKHMHAETERTMGAAKISMMQQVVALLLV